MTVDTTSDVSTKLVYKLYTSCQTVKKVKLCYITVRSKAFNA